MHSSQPSDGLPYPCSVTATGHPLVSDAAAVILENGGNAFDAAVGAGFAGAVVEPCLTSLGGGGFLLAKTGRHKGPSGEILFDFFVDTPGRGLDDIPEPHFFPVNVAFGGSDQEFNIGLGSVAVPGVLKGLLHVHERLGYMDLKEVLQPALDLARGHRINSFQGVFMQLLYPIMTQSPTGRNLYEPDGNYLREGDILANRDLASFLEYLPHDRGKDFYTGDIAKTLVGDMVRGEGLLTLEDLAAYKVIERKPLRAKYRDYTLLTCPPPSFGGTLIALSLGLHQEFATLHPLESVPYIMRYTAIMKEVERLRDHKVLTPKDLESYFSSTDVETSVESIRLFSRGTTHVSVADRDGNVASMTCSNGEGSGYFAPGTGIMLNNMMGEDDLHPEGFHASPPGERVGSMMSPSLLVDGEDRVQLVIGSGGSKRIRTAIAQVLSRVVDYGQAPQSAVDAPRLYWDGEFLQVEPGYGEDILAEVSKNVAVNVWQEKSVYFGGVQVVVPGDSGAGDPRRGGAARVVNV